MSQMPVVSEKGKPKGGEGTLSGLVVQQDVGGDGGGGRAVEHQGARQIQPAQRAGNRVAELHCAKRV